MKAGELLLVPPGLNEIEAGLYRVIVSCPRLQRAALSWRGTLEKGEPLKACTQLLRPRLASAQALDAYVADRVIQVVPEAITPAYENGYVARERRSSRFETAQAILNPLVQPDLLYRMLFCGEWHKHTKEAAQKYSVSAATVLRLLDRYFHLRLDTDLACIRKPPTLTKARTITAKLGRKHKAVLTEHDPAAAGRNADPTDYNIVELFLGSIADHSRSKAQRHRDYLTQFGSTSIYFDDAGYMHAHPNPARPNLSQSQLNRIIDKIQGKLLQEKLAAGEKKINLQHRVITGSARDLIPYPGHTYIIDATVADVYLVSAFDRRLLIGRPVLYIVIDAFSSLIVGIHITLEGPNLAQARIAMYRAVTDRRAWLDWLEVPGLAPYLPQGCRPTIWLADHGEIHSQESRNVQLKLNTTLSLTAPYRAEWKSIVERNFRTLNDQVIHWIPGAVRARVRERGTRDHRLDAVMTIKEFTRLIVRECAKLNLLRDMSRHMSAQLLRRTITANPLGFRDVNRFH